MELARSQTLPERSAVVPTPGAPASVGALAAGAPAAVGAVVGGAAAGSDPRSVYRSHFSFVWRNLRRLGVPRAQAEDAAQDVFLVVHRRWDSYDARWASVETWLFGIVLRVSRDYRRSAWRRLWRFDPATTSEEAMTRVSSQNARPDELAAAREATLMLEQILAELSENKRAVFIMVDIEQMTVPEAAQVLEVNANTAYWRLKAAREEFQRALQRHRARDVRGGAP
jgi:RNA polymerase sigma-70 factor (ECF subfamily)